MVIYLGTRLSSEEDPQATRQESGSYCPDHLETPMGWQQVETVTFMRGCATHWAVLWGTA